MSTINPLPNISLATPSALAPATRGTDGTAGPRVERPATPATPAARPSRPAAPPPPTVPGGRTLSSQAPSGVDPQLWSVLTTEERTHFAKLSAMGPLTYGRGLSAFNVADAPPPAERGARLDIRA